MRKAASRCAATAAGQPVRAGRQPHLQPPQRPAPYQSDGPSSPATPGALQPVLGLDYWTPPPSRRPGRTGALVVTGRLTARRQPRRRRITPNTNTNTTTMISTHNHVDMAASLVGAGAVQIDATAGHPSKQLSHRQATSRSRIVGRATRRLAGTLHPETCPPIWAGQVSASPTPSRSSHEDHHPGPEPHQLEGDDALNALHRRGRGRLARNSFQRFRTAHSLWQPRTAEGLPDIGRPQARGAVDTRDGGSAARRPRQRTRSTPSSGTVRAPAAIPRCRLGLGARGARPASARTHEPGRIVAHEPIGADCPRTGRRLWPG